MLESDFQIYKSKVAKAINERERDRDGFVWIGVGDDEDVHALARAMKELNEEGKFREYHTHISPSKWAVKV